MTIGADTARSLTPSQRWLALLALTLAVAASRITSHSIPVLARHGAGDAHGAMLIGYGGIVHRVSASVWQFADAI